jgi:hypothetical protein
VAIALGVEHKVRVGVESQHGALAAERLCPAHCSADQMLMAQVNAVERADCQHSRALIDWLG